MTGIGRCRGVEMAVLIALLAQFAWPAQPELSVQDYCEISLKVSQLTEAHWTDRISLAQRHQGPMKDLDKQLASADSRYDRLRTQIYAQYGTTFQDYLRYGASHHGAIQGYLENNPQVRSAIEHAQSRVHSLREQLDPVMSRKRAAEARK